MGKLVEVIGVTHNPILPGIFERDLDIEPGIRQVRNNFDVMRSKLAEAKPDAIIVVAGDHLNQTFTDNMPPFLIGKSTTARGPFPHEMRYHTLSEYSADVDITLAKYLIYEGLNTGIDFAFTDEYLIDHAFTMPLSFIRPEMDIPIVPIFTNVMAPPVASAQRFYDVGVAIRNMVERFPEDQRVAVLTSGHMANGVGGPKMTKATAELEFDVNMMRLLEEGEVAKVIEEASFDNLLREGNGTLGFLDFVFALGAANGARPNYVDLNSTQVTASSFFITWDLWSEGA